MSVSGNHHKPRGRDRAYDQALQPWQASTTTSLSSAPRDADEEIIRDWPPRSGPTAPPRPLRSASRSTPAGRNPNRFASVNQGLRVVGLDPATGQLLWLKSSIVFDDNFAGTPEAPRHSEDSIQADPVISMRDAELVEKLHSPCGRRRRLKKWVSNCLQKVERLYGRCRRELWASTVDYESL